MTFRGLLTNTIFAGSTVFCLALNGAQATTLTLATYGTNAGFSLSLFADSFPTYTCCGPLGIAFPSSGGVMVADYANSVSVFSTDTDNQHFSAAVLGQNYGAANAVGLASAGGLIYMTEQGAGQVVQLNNDGTLNQVIVSGFTGATGIAADPANGHLFVSGSSGIFDVNPIAKTATFFAGVNADGLTIDPSGTTLYAETGNHIVGYDLSNASNIFYDSGAIPNGPDGVALGTGSLAGELFINTNNGVVYETSLSDSTHTLNTVATGGTRGDFVAIDPNGTLLLTQGAEIDRLTAPAGGSFATNAPEPASLALFGLPLAALRLLRRRKAG